MDRLAIQPGQRVADIGAGLGSVSHAAPPREALGDMIAGRVARSAPFSTELPGA
jgi:hypothetical protein